MKTMDSTQIGNSSSVSSSPAIITNKKDLQAQFLRLQKLSRKEPITDWDTRKSQLETLETLLSKNKDKLTSAINADFGHNLCKV